MRHYREIATRLDDLFDEKPGYDLLIVGGPEVHAAGVVDALPPPLTKCLAGTFVIDPHTMTAATVLEHSKRVAESYETDEQERLLTRLIDAAASRGAAVIGLDRSTEATNARAVETLVVQADRTTPGSVCDTCGWIAGPKEVTCAACGAEVAWVPDIIDALGESVRTNGGRIQHVVVDSKLAEEEVGAFLRYQAATA